MVPVVGLPPGTQLTLQETLVLLVPVTVAAKVCALPKSNEAVLGVMVAVMEEGGGGGGGGKRVVLIPSLAAAHAIRPTAQARKVSNLRAAKHRLRCVSAILP